MLSCTRFVERLYDEDCRRAMEAGIRAPRDVAEHLAACVECAREWDEAERDLRSLPGLLAATPPGSLERGIRLRLAGWQPTSPTLDWAWRTAWRASVGAAATIAASHAVAPDLAALLGPAVVAFAGASLAFVAGAVRDALPRLTP